MARKPKERPHRAQGARVLVVQADAMLSGRCCEALEARGLRPRAIDDGERALRLMADEGWEAVVLDLELPLIDPLGVVGAVRAHGPTRDLPILALASIPTDDVLELARGRGCDRVLDRALDVVKLAKEVERAVVYRLRRVAA
jgi:DNA-binding response OmpR family regulator